MMKKLFSNLFFIYFVLIIFVVIAAFLSLRAGGPVSITGEDSVINNMILWQVRFPKLIASLLVGAALAVSGYVFQNVLKNPLADPYILGISSGSALGLAIYVSFATALTTTGAELSSYIGALVALTLLMIIFRMIPHNTIVVVLIGIGLSFFFSSIITFLLSYMEGNKLVYMNSWLIGNISQPEAAELIFLSVIFAITVTVIYLFSNALDAMQFGDDFAKTTGVNTKYYSIMFICLASFLTASSVAICGTIGFVGLVIPHIAKLVLKTRSRTMLPVVILLGAGFLALCNAIAGALSFRFEVPIGAVTALIGAPVLIMLIFRRNSFK